MSLQFSRFQILLNMIALFPFCCVVAAESPTRKLTAALIDFDHSSAATLLEAELFKRKEVAWVERTEIDHVLREQKLQTLFAPEVGSARVKLGQLLKAEVLILLREIKPQEKQGTIAMECVVCETKQGLH